MSWVRTLARSAGGLLVAGVILLVLEICLSLALGAVHIPLSQVPGIIAAGPTEETDYGSIIWTLRFPRVIMAILEGASLALAGASMQALFRNPMADPYVLGVSSGASLGAVLGMVTGVTATLGYWSVPLMAFLGGLGIMGAVYALSTRRGRTDTWTLLLSGIAVSSLCSSVIAMLMVMFRERAEEIVFWTMGGLGRSSWAAVWRILPYVIPGIAVVCLQAKALNALSFGEEPAFHLGVPVERIKRILLWASTLIVAAGVAFTGPVGFIGLIVPHAMRILAGPDHTRLLPLSALMGANAMLLSDLLARTMAAPREIPVGVVTAIFGSPFFVYLLVRMRRPRAT